MNSVLGLERLNQANAITKAHAIQYMKEHEAKRLTNEMMQEAR